MLRNEMIEKLAEAQTALYRMADRLEKAEDRLEVMKVHSELGEVVYDLMTEQKEGQ